MKNWATVFPTMANVDLIKHVGQFPYVASLRGYRSRIGCYRNGKFTLVDEIPGVDIDYIKKSKCETRDVVKYIHNHAHDIDVLHMFHVKAKTLVPILIYKILNPNGKVWLDTDANNEWLDSYEKKKHGSICERLEHLFETYVLNLCSLVSAPSSLCAKRLLSIWKISPRRVHPVPLGFLKNKNTLDIMSKEKTFICVGRLGEKQKNVELLINAFCQTMDSHDWNLILIGASTERFRKYLLHKQESYGAFERIIYKGEIYDRDELYKEYARASVFVLPSRFESFGIVLCEAMAQGCYIIESDGNPAHKDIVANERIGVSFRNNRLSDLKDKLMSVINSEHLSADDIMYRCRYSEKFTYPVIYDDLKKYLV